MQTCKPTDDTCNIAPIGPSCVRKGSCRGWAHRFSPRRHAGARTSRMPHSQPCRCSLQNERGACRLKESTSTSHESRCARFIVAIRAPVFGFRPLRARLWRVWKLRGNLVHRPLRGGGKPLRGGGKPRASPDWGETSAIAVKRTAWPRRVSHQSQSRYQDQKPATAKARTRQKSKRRRRPMLSSAYAAPPIDDTSRNPSQSGTSTARRRSLVRRPANEFCFKK